MPTLKEQRRRERVAASQARGKATRAANVRAATQQKRTALEKGGRFREGDEITTVIKGGPQQSQGTHYDLQINESLKIHDDSVSVRQTRNTASIQSKPKTQLEQIKSQTRTEGVPDEVVKKQGRNLSVNLEENLSLSQGKKVGVPKGAAGFLYGTGTIAKLRQQTDEERRQEDLITQISQGAAEGIGGLGASIVAFPISVGYDIKGVLEGKQFGEGSKEFREYVESELRPSTVSQAFSHIVPGAEKQEIRFDPTSLSRAGGEIGGLFVGAKSSKVPTTPKQPKGPAGKFTETKINLGDPDIKSYPVGEGPAFPLDVYQRSLSVKLGAGPGKTVLREPTPPKSPFTEDRATKFSGKNVFGEKPVNLGSGVTKLIENQAKQTQKSGQQTIQKQKTVKKEEPEILFSKPRFTDEQKPTQAKGGTVYEEPVGFVGDAPQGPTLLKNPQPLNVLDDTSKSFNKEINKITNPKTETKINTSIKGFIGSREKTKFRDDVTLVHTTIPKENLKIRDDIITRLGIGEKNSFKFRDDLVTDLVTEDPGGPPPGPELPPPPKPPFVPPVGGLPYFPRGSFYSGGYPRKGSGKRVYETFGISSDINVKYIERVLPKSPSVRTSYSPRIFSQLQKEDKRAIAKFYGRKTRRKKKKKT